MLTSAISSTISTTSACPACQRPYGPITPAFDERRSALLDWVTLAQDALAAIKIAIEREAGL